MWHVLNRATGFRKPKTKNFALQSQQAAKECNHYFTNVSTAVHQELQDTVETFRIQPNTLPVCEQDDPPQFDLRMSTIEDIDIIIKKIDPSKATGHDNIGPAFLKIASSTIAPVLSNLINSSIKSGIFPNDHKIAKVTPLHKKGEKTQPSNYRPVSILAALSKISERFIADRVVEHVEGNGLINLHQSGFRRGHGTHFALHHMIDNWATALSQKKCVAVLAIDMSKAFDCLNHEAIFESLERLGIRSCKLLQDYLCNRKQFVSCNGFESDLATILNGVPQGSILGPLLFILTISDIENVIKACLHMFADDLTTWQTGNTWSDMRNRLEQTAQEFYGYLAFKGLCINMSKCHLMLLGKQFLDVSTTVKMSIFHHDVIEEPEIVLLGVKIDNRLSFENHISEIAAK